MSIEQPIELLDVETQPTVDPATYPPAVQDALEHAHGTEDPVWSAAPSPRALSAVPELAQVAQPFWLPEGHHFDLHIEHRPLESAGPFTGGGNKWVHHITVSPWFTVDSMWTVLRDKRAAAHLLIGGRHGVKHPIVIQMIPFNLAGRALEHPSGPETNRADCIQLEVCAMPEDVHGFPERTYQAIANLIRLTNLTNPKARDVPRKLARLFREVDRFGGQEFVDARGHCGHMHVPGNTHFDPTKDYKGSHLMVLLHDMPHANGYSL